MCLFHRPEHLHSQTCSISTFRLRSIWRTNRGRLVSSRRRSTRKKRALSCVSFRVLVSLVHPEAVCILAVRERSRLHRLATSIWIRFTLIRLLTNSRNHHSHLYISGVNIRHHLRQTVTLNSA